MNMKKPRAKPVQHTTTIRLDAAIVAQLDKHAAAAEGGARPRSWVIEKAIVEWLKAQGDKVNLLGHTQGISE
jgi:predicted transcriptional regulator